MMAILLQTWTLTTMGDETKLTRFVDAGLTKGGPAPPALYN